MQVDYIRQSLSEDEELIHIAEFHWMYTVNAVFNVIFGIAFSVAILWFAMTFQPAMFGQVAPQSYGILAQIDSLHPAVKILSFFVFVLGILKFAQMMIIKVTTEIGVTDIRLVYKRGLVARAVGEINIDRIEGVNVLQGIMGRLFGYGRVMVRGMGVGEVVLPPISQPIRFKKAIEKARIKAKRRRETPDPGA
ncbi:MAG: PH domain-containing protein [Pseudomonadota bacterium]